MVAASAPEAPASAETAPAATPAPVYDADTPPPTTYDRLQHTDTAQDFQGESLLRQLGRTVLGLVFVVALIYLTLKVLLPKVLNMRHVVGGQSLKVIERVQLDARHALVLVDVRGEQTLLVATGEQGVQLLTHVEARSDARERYDKA